MMFEDVLKQAQAEMLDFNNSGMSINEMSHRTKVFDAVIKEAEALLRELMNIPENYKVLFVQGGASQQFDAIPLNLMNKFGKADYVISGHFAKKAFQAAKKYGDVAIAGSSEEDVYTHLPSYTFREDIDYVHITSNNTIFGTKYTNFPETKAPLVCDMSSNILSEPVDVSKFGMIYAGAQKNIGPAGLTIVIIREDLIGNAKDICPIMLNYKTHADNESMYNTPPCFPIYMAMLTFRHLKKLGGVEAIAKINREKAQMLYDYIDSSSFYTNKVNPADRSIMNVPFVTPNADLDAQFVKEAANEGLVTLKGHRLVGGMRASIYNAMPVEGVQKLIAFMRDFEAKNA